MTILQPHEFPAIKDVIGEASDLAYVSGSLAAGLGNATSDIDVFVVYRDRPERAISGAKIFILDDGRTVDLERFTYARMLQVSERVNEVDEHDLEAVSKIPYSFLDLYYRTAIGQGFVNPSDFDELQQRFTRDRGSVVYGAWATWQAATAMATMQSHVAEGRLLDAYFQARRGLRLAVNARMAAEGDGYPNHKWAFVKLEKRHGAGSELFRAASMLRGLAGRSIEAYVAEVAAFCSSIGLPELRASARSTLQYRWAGEARLFHIRGEHLLVHNKVHIYHLNRSGRLICNLVSSNGTAAEMSAALVERFEISLAAAELRVEAFLDRLQARGMVRSEPAFSLAADVSLAQEVVQSGS